ncbi:MAG: IPT/TIG domain-containing protein, partial [Cyanobacteria bacterium NC_groundwater_1444_Ag_S-0.65um_54_12]|nr:IPT/TIG domain-containing protein [Cyanobacteria bacterium NC_groundwater_1444_Ag_S-0.65um_54_12]
TSTMRQLAGRGKGELGLLALALVVSCTIPLPRAAMTTDQELLTAKLSDIAGVADFGRPDRGVAATMGDVAKAATVSLIDTATNTTISTTVTRADGSFLLGVLGAWSGTVYILEAVKGLNDNRPGYNAARVRTLIRNNGERWVAITAGRVMIDTSTTALTILQGSYQANNRSGPAAIPGNYIGIIETVSSVRGVPDTLLTGQTVVDPVAFNQVYMLVRSALDIDADPVAAVRYNGGNDTFSVVTALPPAITGIWPSAGSVGSEVTVYGQGFSVDAEANTVTFNGTPAVIKSGNSSMLVVTVPEGATTGLLSVMTPGGSSNSTAFTVVPGFSGTFRGTS